MARLARTIRNPELLKVKGAGGGGMWGAVKRDSTKTPPWSRLMLSDIWTDERLKASVESWLCTDQASFFARTPPGQGVPEWTEPDPPAPLEAAHSRVVSV